ncbi:MAG TPA: hypothetical protein VFE79_21800 [Paraburkholderia sp.]|jgi:hypothetical protein|nr:hypothetical protein [Paraburkholderia sp.]
MNGVRRGVDALIGSARRLGSRACLIGLRHGSVLVALPLCSSVCFFGLRIVFSALGLSV